MTLIQIYVEMPSYEFGRFDALVSADVSDAEGLVEAARAEYGSVHAFLRDGDMLYDAALSFTVIDDDGKRTHSEWGSAPSVVSVEAL